jgi:hypothetical protein
MPMKDRVVLAQRRFARVTSDAGKELSVCCAALDYSQVDLDFADVVLGFLARQYQLWSVVVVSPSAWTTPASPLLLRALVDATITLAWIEANPDSARRFKVYSAGRLKLLAEHWRRIGSEQAQSWCATYADQMEDLASTELWSGVLPVELSNWNGKDIRTMAEEVDLKDAYDITYSPLSADAHSEWMVLRTKYLRPCQEPAHRSHWLPVFERPVMDTGVPTSATACFHTCVRIGLGALGLAYVATFWKRIERRVASATALLRKAHGA